MKVPLFYLNEWGVKMTDILLIALLIINIFLLVVILTKNNSNDKIENNIREEMLRNRTESSKNFSETRTELSNSINGMSNNMTLNMNAISSAQKEQLNYFSTNLENLTKSNEIRMENMRKTVEEKLQALQKDNSEKLEQMRATVDEKLQSTLEKRLGESFKLVSERLEQVQRGLGEMQSLANGVGDLKKVLSNVKTRGIWGEIQLGNLLEQILTKDQYAVNVITAKGSNDRVEFAVKLPSKSDNDEIIWLPIDSKFPIEDYTKLLVAQENVDTVQIEIHSKAIEARIKAEAKDIKDKYLDPPNTTDFGILFLPIEGLYAEVLRRPGLIELLQREYRIVVTGPTTLSALLNSLQMGFKTLAIEKRSSEVWQTLGIVKQEFVTFGEILDKTKKKLQEASNTIDRASQRSRAIQRKLKDIQALPNSENSEFFITEEFAEINDGDEV